MERYAGQSEHIENIGIAHLVADGKGDHVKVFDGPAVLQRPKGQIVLPHSLFHIAPGCKNTLAPDTLHLVHDTVQDAHAQIGHTNLIGIRKTKRNIYPDILRILLNFVKFSAGVTSRFLHCGENALQ